MCLSPSVVAARPSVHLRHPWLVLPPPPTAAQCRRTGPVDLWKLGKTAHYVDSTAPVNCDVPDPTRPDARGQCRVGRGGLPRLSWAGLAAMVQRAAACSYLDPEIGPGNDWVHGPWAGLVRESVPRAMLWRANVELFGPGICFVQYRARFA